MNPIEFRAHREALGLSQTRLAEYLDVQQAAISQWETGARPLPMSAVMALGTLDDLADDLIDQMTALIEHSDNPVALITYTDDEVFWSAQPEARGVPAVVHRVCAALVARMSDGQAYIETW